MKKKQRLNALVLDPSKGFALEHIDEPQGGQTLGRQWYYGKSPVYLLQRKNGTGDSNSKLEPVELPPKLSKWLPERLYRALHWEQEAGILFTLQNTLLEKLKIMAVYILIAILLLFIFLIFSSLMG